MGNILRYYKVYVNNLHYQHQHLISASMWNINDIGINTSYRWWSRLHAGKYICIRERNCKVIKDSCSIKCWMRTRHLWNPPNACDKLSFTYVYQRTAHYLPEGNGWIKLTQQCNVYIAYTCTSSSCNISIVQLETNVLEILKLDQWHNYLTGQCLR